MARLQREGYPVRVPRTRCAAWPTTRPPRRLPLRPSPAPIVLVGHSYGGAVITDAATGDADVKALVYVDAFAPAEGETVFPLARRRLRARVRTRRRSSTSCRTRCPCRRRRPLPPAAGLPDLLRQRRTGEGRRHPLRHPASHRLQRGQSAVADVPAWKTIPSWYLLEHETGSSPLPLRGRWRSAQDRRSSRSGRGTSPWSPTPVPSPTSSTRAAHATD